MNKTLTISLTILLLLAGGALIFSLVASNQKSTTTSGRENPSLPVAGTATQQSGTLTIQENNSNRVSTSNRGTVQTNNFMSDPTTVQDPINPGYYYLGYHPQEGVSDPTASKAPPYVIEYIASTNYFNIALLQEPIGSTRDDAQQYLMTRLGISETQMCQLNYMVSVPSNVNSQFSGESLGFSFCPGSVKLPQ